MTAAPDYALRFLGVGNANAVELGSSSVVIERDGAPLLLVDCGQEALTAYLAHYGEPPHAVFITHTHMDHVAGMERLFVRLYFDAARRGRCRLYVPAALVPWLQQRVADYPGVLAEGGVNYWDAFRLIPHRRGFWHAGLWFDVFAVRHHAPDTAFGLALRGSLVYTGDTRPIPETLARFTDDSTLVAHDCALVGNPSHSGIDDLEREYPRALLDRVVLYHYASATDGDTLRARGYRVARPGDRFALAPPRTPGGDVA
ncbi:MBL fold metallo-hydrolase [Chiayiivirga flava]|uniref:Ribonuclease BN (tRNA processing enzyme) n=1 Tax=Chiayiivirga flava TaxID=659595 RepID=A0A7W8G026_9GAMM|nr:MBL fold metallo-hydrolase [Chiayiivirga flava]MBB5209062.1 ribonuclease BN (tRNA processing enzyme) [Chiayiivirga flava]